MFRPEGKFVVDGFSPFDIMQGATGDCWFLSSISALAEKRPLADRVINPTANSTAAAQEGGIYKFQFYRMGEWHDVIINDQIPMSAGILFGLYSISLVVSLLMSKNSKVRISGKGRPQGKTISF